MTTAKIDISVIVPLYNEEDSVAVLYAGIKGVLDKLSMSHEILFVDDGSKDNTFLKAKSLAQADSSLRVIRFRKNYGQTPAMVAGIDHARGEVLITMDGDLQNDPTDIPRFLEQIAQGFDIVVGWRHNRQDKLISRKIPSRIANRLIGAVTGVPIKDNGCSLKAYRAAVIKKVPLYSEMHRFIPAMLSIAGVKIAEIKVQHHARRFGVSKYGLSRIYKVLLDLLTIKTLVSFLARPLWWFGSMGFICGIVSLLIFLVNLIDYFQHGNYSVVFMGIALLLATLATFLFLAGVLCDLIYRTGTVKQEHFSGLTALTINL